MFSWFYSENFIELNCSLVPITAITKGSVTTKLDFYPAAKGFLTVREVSTFCIPVFTVFRVPLKISSVWTPETSLWCRACALVAHQHNFSTIGKAVKTTAPSIAPVVPSVVTTTEIYSGVTTIYTVWENTASPISVIPVFIVPLHISCTRWNKHRDKWMNIF